MPKPPPKPLTTEQIWKRLIAAAKELGFEKRLALQEPISEKRIKEFEKELGLKLPKDFRDSYLIYDGQKDDLTNGILAGYALSNLETIMASRSLMFDPGEDFHKFKSSPVGYVRKYCDCPYWLPITDDGGGNMIGIDLAPDKKGVYGQVILYGRDHDKHVVIAESFKDFLEKLLAYYEKGHIGFIRDRDLNGKVNEYLMIEKEHTLMSLAEVGGLRRPGLPKLLIKANADHQNLPRPEIKIDEKPKFRALPLQGGIPYKDKEKMLKFYTDVLGCSVDTRFDGKSQGKDEIIHLITSDFQDKRLVPAHHYKRPQEISSFMPERFAVQVIARLEAHRVSYKLGTIKDSFRDDRTEPTIEIVDPEGNKLIIVRKC